MMFVTKANTRSTVHRPGYIDYIGVKRYEADGAVVGEHRFVGFSPRRRTTHASPRCL